MLLCSTLNLHRTEDDFSSIVSEVSSSVLELGKNNTIMIRTALSDCLQLRSVEEDLGTR
jgi:hypothetical protein